MKQTLTIVTLSAFAFLGCKQSNQSGTTILDNSESIEKVDSTSDEPATISTANKDGEKLLDIPIFGTYDLSDWEEGPEIKLEEEEIDGTSRVYSLEDKKIIVEKREVGEYGYTITHRLVGENKNLLKLHEVGWENVNDETTGIKFKLYEAVYDFELLPHKKHYREQEMKTHYYKMDAKPESVEGEFISEVLDKRKMKALKAENNNWWEGL